MMTLKNPLRTIVGITFLATISLSCQSNSKKSESNSTPSSNSTDSIAVTPPESAPPEKKAQINYHIWNLKGNDSLRKVVNKHYTGDSLEILRQINRTDKKFWKNKDTFLMPEPFDTDLMAYSLFPQQLEIIKDVEKFVIFSYELQIFGVYSQGQLVKWGATNMGKKATPTPTGLFFTNWKGKRVVSTVNSSWILQYNFNISNLGGVGWHQYDMPGYPASHSCLRLFLEDAMWLYEYADMWKLKDGQKISNGTPVIVFGEYPWGQSKPWFRLLDSTKDHSYSVQDMTEIISPHLEKIRESESNRLALKNTSTTDSIQ